jgi:hypothetical protein
MFKKNKQRTLFHASEQEWYPDVKPAKSFVPDWYKTTKSISKNIKRLPLSTSSFKMCTPFQESFTSGYMISLAVDLAVEIVNGNSYISWTDQNSIYVEIRNNKENSNIPVPIGCSAQQFAFKTKNVILFPKGYSALITHPFNRFDLPFVVPSGIVDGEFLLTPGNIPFFIKQDFEGIIPMGTPIIQILPFKRENWSSKKDNTLLQKSFNVIQTTLNSTTGWYKKNIWIKKTFE